MNYAIWNDEETAACCNCEATAFSFTASIGLAKCVNCDTEQMMPKESDVTKAENYEGIAAKSATYHENQR